MRHLYCWGKLVREVRMGGQLTTILLLLLMWESVDSYSGFETADKRLNDHLKSVSDPLVLPRTNASHTVKVRVSLALNYLVDIDDKQETLTTVIWVVQEWVNPLMAWNSSDYEGITSHILSTENMWTPRIWILQLLEASRADEPVYGNHIPAFIEQDGSTLIYPVYHLTSSCSLNIYRYPFDEQTCPLTLLSWTHRAEDVIYELLQEPFKTWTYSPGKWSVLSFKSTGGHVAVGSYPAVNLSIMDFELRIRRNPLLPLLTIIFPLFMLNLIVMGSLFMDPSDEGRLNLGTTAFLSYTMLIIIVTDSLPASSTTIPFIGVIFLCSLTFTLITTLWTLALGKLLKEGEPIPAAKWMKKMCLRNSKKSYGNEVTEFKMPSSDEKDSTDGVDLRRCTKLVDRLLFVLFLLFNFSTMVTMASWGSPT